MFQNYIACLYAILVAFIPLIKPLEIIYKTSYIKYVGVWHILKTSYIKDVGSFSLLLFMLTAEFLAHFETSYIKDVRVKRVKYIQTIANFIFLVSSIEMFCRMSRNHYILNQNSIHFFVAFHIKIFFILKY